jgi:hypothetical protein
VSPLDRAEVVWEGATGRNNRGGEPIKARVVVRYLPNSLHMLYVEECLSDSLGDPRWAELPLGETRERILALAVAEIHQRRSK